MSELKETNRGSEAQVHRVVVYCASSPDIDVSYFEAADELGRLLAKEGMEVVTGAGRQGLMGAVNDAVLDAGGVAVGVIPQFMVDNGWYHQGLSEMVVTEDMHERKMTMARMVDAAVALPGGLGTLEELAEVLTWRQLELFDKPVIVLNVGGFYDPLLEMLDRMIDEGFMSDQYRGMWQVAESPQHVLEILKGGEHWEPSFAKYDKKEL